MKRAIIDLLALLLAFAVIIAVTIFASNYSFKKGYKQGEELPVVNQVQPTSQPDCIPGEDGKCVPYRNYRQQLDLY